MTNAAARIVTLVIVAAAVGCGASTDKKLKQMAADGEYGAARMRVQSGMTDNQKDRDYLLDRMRLGIVSMADGVSESGDSFDEAYGKLREQGLNDDKTVAIFMVGDKVNFWKGEPFEQAMCHHYYGLWNATNGDWGNARAAASESLFFLKDFGTDEEGNRKDAEAIIKADQASDEDFIESGYVAVKSDFALGYLMHGIASQQLGRIAEANDNFREAETINPWLKPLVSKLQSSGYNTILVVDYGPGPEKYGRGPDNAIADFRPLLASDPNPLVVKVGATSDEYPIACDLNVMAGDHMWKGIEDLRIAKSRIGTVLMAAGAATMAASSYSNNNSGAWVGLAILLAGAIQKASAHADTTHCEVMPQRVYVAPVDVQSQRSTIELQVYGHAGSRMVLTGISPPKQPGAKQLRYVRLHEHDGPAPAWATSGEILYCNDAVPDAADCHLPYILGGRCVCTPSWDVLESCRQKGYLEGMSLPELEELYRLEGIQFAGPGQGLPGEHVLEGGRWMYTPLPGTAGFARCFGQPHSPYKPRSKEVKALRKQIETDELARRTPEKMQ